jgi:hypothetical protein
MDLTHHYIGLHLRDEAERVRLDAQLIGPSRAGALMNSVRMPRTGEVIHVTPPVWWRGDANASRAGVLAMTTMRG